MAKKELQVSAIENGTVIDHIPADKLFDVINVLGITGMDNAMTFGANLKSSKLGKKAIIKIWDKFLEDDEVNKLALVLLQKSISSGIMMSWRKRQLMYRKRLKELSNV